MSDKRIDFTNDDIAKLAQEIAEKDNCIVWQREKYLLKARKQLEIETQANRLAAARTSVTTPAELAKVDEDNATRLRTLQKRSESLIAR